MAVRWSVVPYSSQTAVPLLGHEPGEVFCIRDECLRLQSNVTSRQDVSGLCLSIETSVWTYIVPSDYHVAIQQFVNVIMFNDLKCRD